MIEDKNDETSYKYFDLPVGWAWTKLGEVGYVRLGKTPRKSDYADDGIYKIIKFRDISETGLDLSIPKDGFVKNTPTAIKGLRKVSTGDVLLTSSAHSGDQIGKKCAFVESLPDCEGGVFFVGELLGVSADVKVIDSKWPYLWFKDINGQKAIQRAVAGVHLTSGRAQEIPIPIAPLAEQKRIVAKVEELFARINAAREHLNRIPSILKRFRQSVLAAACSGKLTEDWRERNGINGYVSKEDNANLPHGWKELLLTEVASKEPRSIQSGPFGSNLLHSEFTDKGKLVIGIDNVGDGIFTKGKQHRIPEKKFQELKKYQARPLDVLITVMATIGRCCVVPEDIETAIITKHVYRISTDKKVVLPHYLLFTFRGAPSVIAQINAQIRGQTRPGINGKILKSLLLPIPPVEEQIEIIGRVRKLLDFSDSIEAKLNSAEKYSDKLTQSILYKAFHGELVSLESELSMQEGREYESAEVLLARIKAEREAAEPKKKPRKAGRKKKKEPLEEAKQEAAPSKAVEQEESEKPSPKKKLSRKEHIFDTDEVMRLFRTACRGTGETSEDDLLREVARQLDYQRLSKGIKHELKGHLKTAIRRNILERDGSILKAATPRFNDYEDDFLQNTLKSVMRKGYEYDRDEITKAIATYLGFSTVTQSISTRMKSVYNSGIRRGIIENNGLMIQRL